MSQWHGGKGSGRRKMDVTQEEYDNRWDHIFRRDLPEEDNTGTSKNEYQDILSTEEALLRSNEETREALRQSK